MVSATWQRPARDLQCAALTSAGDDTCHAEAGYDLGDEGFGGDHQQAFETDMAAVAQQLDARTADQRRHTVGAAAPQVRARLGMVTNVQIPTHCAHTTASMWRLRRNAFGLCIKWWT